MSHPCSVDPWQYYVLQQNNVKRFFEDTFYDLPRTRTQAVPMGDSREELRGQATVCAEGNFKPWDIIGAYTGRVLTEEVRLSEGCRR